MQRLLATGVLLDEGMVYFDARLSVRYPTVEVRVADVCLRTDDAVLLAGLVRGLVDTAARDWRAGRPPPPVPGAVIRAAAWRASRSGLDDQLVHPLSGVPRAAADVVADLQAHVADALAAAGDAETVGGLLDETLARGNGAQRQREVYGRTESFAAVALDAAAATAATSSAASTGHLGKAQGT